MLRFGHVPCAVTKWDSRQFDAYVINYCVNGIIERRGDSTEVQTYLEYLLLIATTSIQPNIQQSVKFSNLVRKRFSDLENIPPELESSSEKKNTPQTSVSLEHTFDQILISCSAGKCYGTCHLV